MNNFMNGYNNNLPPQAYTGYTPQPLQQFNNYNPQPVNSGIYTEFRFMNEDEFKGQVVNPNCRLYALDKEKMRFYVKATDGIGNTTIDKFTLSKESDQPVIDVPVGVSKEELNCYVTKDDFGAELGKLKTELNNKLDALNKLIDIRKTLGDSK